MTGLWDISQGIGVQFQAEARAFSFPHQLQNPLPPIPKVMNVWNFTSTCDN